MKRTAALIAVTLVLAACGAATSPSGSAGSAISPAPSDPPILPATAPPSPMPTPVSAVRDLSIYSLPQADDLFRGSRIASMAGSPTGAVILGTDGATGALESWTSTDGDDWQRHWLPDETFGGGSPALLVGGDFGFAAAGWKFDGRNFISAIWLSSDGTSWSESPDAGLPSGQIQSLVAGPSGIAAGLDVGGSMGTIATSVDGRTWRSATFPSHAIPNSGGLVALPDGFIAMGSVDGLDSGGGSVSMSMAWRSRDGLAWTADADLAKDLTGRPNSIEGWTLSPYGAVGWDVTLTGIAAISSQGLVDLPAAPSESGRLVGGPAGLYWIAGTQVSATCSAAWQYDGRTWLPLDRGASHDPCVDGPSILGSAAVSGGLVILGILGDNAQRAAWLIRAPGNAPSAVVAGAVATAPKTSIPDPLAATIGNLSICPPVPTTVDQLVGLDPWLGAGCFGDRALSFRAWVVDPGEGYGGTCEAFTPVWIRECVLPAYLLSSGAGVDLNAVGADELHAMRSSSATGDLAGVGRWVQVTGHYDDPASPTCRFDGGGGAIDFEPEAPRALAVLECRLVFVVTHLRTVPAA